MPRSRGAGVAGVTVGHSTEVEDPNYRGAALTKNARNSISPQRPMAGKIPPNPDSWTKVFRRPVAKMVLKRTSL